ncbi:MAG: diguanylate cyclase [Burkholderiaceae bacterium]
MSNSVSRMSLKQLLTVPYVALVILAALVIGLLSYQAGSDAVNTLSDRLLSETVSRIQQAVDKHVSGSEAVLDTAFPPDIPAPTSIKDELDELRTRFWLATTIHRDPNNYAYYGNRRGEFLGLWRFSETEAELRLRPDGQSPRSIFRYSKIDGELQDPDIESRVFEPRERPWYKAGQQEDKQTWTAIYIDFKTLELVSTRARRVIGPTGEFEGVVATDLSLELLNQFLKTLGLSQNGFAFIVEPDGQLVATSRGPHLQMGENNQSTRLNAGNSEDPWISTTYAAVRKLASPGARDNEALTTVFEGPTGELVQAGYTRLRDDAGLDWIVAVAVPRDDFMHKVTANVKRTAALALLACLAIGLTGYMVLGIISKELRKLSAAVKAMSDGDHSSTILTDRQDEIGDLAKTFSAMQQKLLTDRLTGIPNREAVVRRVEDRIINNRRRDDHHPFALMFIDLNDFKKINDRLGHDIGDQVLVEIGEKLVASIRPDDIAARFGGDEFIVMLDKTRNAEEANTIRDKLEGALNTPLATIDHLPPSKSRPNTISATVGISIYPDHGADFQSLLKHADNDMYYRKQQHKAVDTQDQS